MRTTLCFLLIAVAVAQICAMPADAPKVNPKEKAADGAKTAKELTDKGKAAATGAETQAEGAAQGFASSFLGIMKDGVKLGKDSMDMPTKFGDTMASGMMKMF